jgi:23S rRNA (cytidine1920-2'-O)/16S rRNA (cytidine1409-2'-O)-methyltransferase
MRCRTGTATVWNAPGSTVCRFTLHGVRDTQAMTSRMRIDRLLVERGLFESRAKAHAAIAAGLVTADDRPVWKASQEIATNAVLKAAPEHPYVSRGGIKLAAALDHFGFDPKDRVCLDVGASTGGFTDVLLGCGARHVYAVDVGHGQLHPRLRGNTRVTAFEETDIRTLSPALLAEPPDLVTIDVSFISLSLVLPPALALTQGKAELVALIKPQFEAGRAHLKKGIVHDARVQAEVCDRTTNLVAGLGWGAIGVIPSPIAGGDGNREFLLGARRD